MIVLVLVPKMADVELEGRPAAWSDAINLVVDTLLSTLVDEKIIPEAESNDITKARIWVHVVISVCLSFRLLQTSGIGGSIVRAAAIRKSVVSVFPIEVSQAQKLNTVRSPSECYIERTYTVGTNTNICTRLIQSPGPNKTGMYVQNRRHRRHWRVRRLRPQQSLLDLRERPQVHPMAEVVHRLVSKFRLLQCRGNLQSVRSRQYRESLYLRLCRRVSGSIVTEIVSVIPKYETSVEVCASGVYIKVTGCGVMVTIGCSSVVTRVDGSRVTTAVSYSLVIVETLETVILRYCVVVTVLETVMVAVDPALALLALAANAFHSFIDRRLVVIREAGIVGCDRYGLSAGSVTAAQAVNVTSGLPANTLLSCIGLIERDEAGHRYEAHIYHLELLQPRQRIPMRKN
ncbi:hypothetical protein KCU70_g191, partial [Aureobasidium melanogenum]